MKKIAIIGHGNFTKAQELAADPKSKGSILDNDVVVPRGINIVRDCGIGSLELSEPCLSGRAKRRERRKKNRTTKNYSIAL